MTKEMKRPISNITQDSIKPLLSNAVEFYTNKNREAHKCIQERDEYINYLESKLSNARPQQALPVVPDFIGKLINTFGAPEDGKHINYTASYLEIQKELDWIDNHQKTWLTALLIGFTVEKPQLFYLKHIDMSKSDAHLNWYLAKGTDNVLIHQGIKKGKSPKLKCILKLTQQEIDSMQTGSYEQIEVTE
ncbi:DUF1642 domain-containing protein [Lactococcus lactis]|uniref:DUF1642 domain-containing protein n=1 Tax=Lactococcus lactis TaxID=1358 RepID=UPI0038D04D21